jgi:hypothetical protein
MTVSRVFSRAAVAASLVAGGTAVALLNPAPAVANPLAEGTYRFDFGEGPSSFQFPEQKRPPYTWMLAIRSACPPSGCVATAKLLDDAGTPMNWVYRETNRHWDGNAFQGFVCNNKKTAGTNSQSFDVSPDGTLVGISIDSAPGCEPISRPFTATRVGDLPAGVDVADPSTA